MWRSFITIGALVGLTACGDGNPFTEQATDETTGPLTVNGTELNEFLTGDGFAYNDNGTADPSDDTMIVNNIAFDNSDTSGGDYTFQRALPSGFSLYESPLLNIPDERRFFAVFKRSEHAQTTTVATNDYIGFGFGGLTAERLGQAGLTRLSATAREPASEKQVRLRAKRGLIFCSHACG